MDLRMIKDYRDIPEYRCSFNELAGLVFGIDFERWYQLGFWNDRYVCHSFLDGDRVVANVSASRLEILAKGQRIDAVQIGTVMTHPEYRKRRLGEELMHTVLEAYKDRCAVIFLFGNKSAVDFYPRFGFSTATETLFSADYREEGERRCRARRLDLQDMRDISLLKRRIGERIPLSRVFGVEHAGCILAWHCLNVFPRDIYYLEAMDTLAIFKVKDGMLHLYDIVAKEKPDMRQIIGEIAPEGTKKVVFHFTPDCEGLPIESRPYTPEDYVFFIKPASAHFAGEFYYPYTAHA